MASVDKERTKQLKIKTGVVKRLAKEKQYYENDVTKMAAKIETMKSEGKDEYDIRKQEEVKSESEMMIPDCKRKLATAWDDLSKLVEGDKDLEETEEYKAATAILEDTKQAAHAD